MYCGNGSRHNSMQHIHNLSSTIRAASEWSFFPAMYVLVCVHLHVPWKLNSACSGLHATRLQLLGHIFFRMTCVRCNARSRRSGVCTGVRATRRYHLWVLNRQHREAHLFCSTEGFFLSIDFLFFLVHRTSECIPRSRTYICTSSFSPSSNECPSFAGALNNKASPWNQFLATAIPKLVEKH